MIRPIAFDDVTMCFKTRETIYKFEIKIIHQTQKICLLQRFIVRTKQKNENLSRIQQYKNENNSRFNNAFFKQCSYLRYFPTKNSETITFTEIVLHALAHKSF